MTPTAGNFALLDAENRAYPSSRIALLPIPFERTTSYGKGTAHGPEALIRASQALETWDDELRSEPFRAGISTLPPVDTGQGTIEEALADFETEATRHLEAGKFLVSIGGEHSLTLATVRATKKVHGEIGVVQFDAHADLRDEYEGSPFSHACVMRRVLEEDLVTFGVGIRSLSAPEERLIDELGLATIRGQEMSSSRGGGREALRRAFLSGISTLPRKVYLTFDIDFFDPSLVPATGTPEPGGGDWYPTLELLRLLFETKDVVAMDLVELAPIPGQPASDFLAAKLIYKCLGYLQAFGV